MTKDIDLKAIDELIYEVEMFEQAGVYPIHDFIGNLKTLAAKVKVETKLEGCVVVLESEYTELKSDKKHFSNACIDWTDRAYKQRAKVEHIKNEVERFKQSGTHLDLSNFLENLIEFATFKHDDELKDFVLIKLNENCVHAIEQEVEQQVEASGITADVFRLDGEKILNAMIEAARGGK
ncbi:hypothetical protein HWI77_11730 [Acinetobacter venetianus]|uniref:hypothetical protein n=1 Tax=Acinetobacter venetianus TaxID=52133 RepID=UPI00177D08B7|nr:hypothetical protein [Acinetobacter venetianus]QNH50385.1 hypothetical protein HWI77_11730 [Acinetobacter venetianus]